MLHFEEEKMSNEFTKHHIKGLPFDAVLHQFTDRDKGSAHDHPFSFTTHILSGSYVERVFFIKEDGSWYCDEYLRIAGTSHLVESTHIHEIIQLPEGECWTLIVPQKNERTSRFWKFEGEIISYRLWHETEFTPIKK